MSEQQTVELIQPIELDRQKLLGFRDLTSLDADLGHIEEELDDAHVKIGVEEGPPATKP